MRILLVTPVDVGSGETITTWHMANQVIERGGDVRFLASSYAHRFLSGKFPAKVDLFTQDAEQNRDVWETCVKQYQPDAIVFSDYPLFFFSNGVSPLADKEEWARSLERLGACLITLDHTGFAQRAQGIFFGPPHLSFHYEKIPAIPDGMGIMLPCPMNEPADLSERRGRAFRFWDTPLTVPSEDRQAIRRRFLEREDDLLVFHAVARWAWESAEAFRLTYYQNLPGILEYYLADLPKRVTVVSVNDGQLLQQPSNAKIRVVNLDRLPAPEFEALMFASDLMLTENRISISLGKAVCGLLPCAALRNSFTFRQLMESMSGPLRDLVWSMEAQRAGAIYPYELFPGGTREWLDQVQLYRDNSLTEAFKTLEIFGEDSTRRELHALLVDPAARECLRSRQAAYAGAVQQLPDAERVLRQFLRGQTGAQ